MNDIFQNVGSLKPQRSNFDLSYPVIANCDMGEVIPILLQEAVPGDYFSIGNQAVVRTEQLVAPAYQLIKGLVNYFFVPNRLLWEQWEEFITGGEDGQSTAVYPVETLEKTADKDTTFKKYDFYDYAGMPLGNTLDGVEPSTMPLTAYNLIYNEWYRDQNLQDKRELTDRSIFKRAWEKDYFTSALPFQQRGIAPSVPLTGIGKVLFNLTNTNTPRAQGSVYYDDITNFVETTTAGLTGNASAIQGANKKIPDGRLLKVNVNIGQGSDPQASVAKWEEWLNNNSIDLTNVGTFNVSDLRNIVQLQKWMERNARAGVRYTEFLKAHFGVSPTDSRLDRPELIFSTSFDVVISEVTQMSETATTPLGTLAGNAKAVSTESAKNKYYVEEYGWIIGLMTIRPEGVYGSQGVPRAWRRKSRLEQFYPEFVNLSEQAIDKAELCVDLDMSETHTAEQREENNLKIFGYQERYGDMKTRQGIIAGDMRDTLVEWHQARIFDKQPALNSEFIECNPSKRIFNAQKATDKSIIFYFFNMIYAVRPLPFISEPGLTDHH